MLLDSQSHLGVRTRATEPPHAEVLVLLWLASSATISEDCLMTEVVFARRARRSSWLLESSDMLYLGGKSHYVSATPPHVAGMRGAAGAQRTCASGCLQPRNAKA